MSKSRTGGVVGWRWLAALVVMSFLVNVLGADWARAAYTDNGNGTVTDTVTGLMWQQQDDNQTRNWEGAITYCEGLSLAGFTDWRLPDVMELASITDDSNAPAIDSIAFPGTNSSNYFDYYWSSTSYASNSSFAWHVAFGTGRVDKGDSINGNKANSYYVRCVHNGAVSWPLSDLEGITGITTNSAGSLSLPGVTVSTATGASTTGDDQGHYALTLVPGTHTLTASKSGYQAIVIPGIVVRAGEQTVLNLPLPAPGEPLNVIREAFLPGSVGQPYADWIWVIGGNGPYAFSLSYGTLPPGCTLDPATGAISGTTSTPGSYTFGIGVTDQQNGLSEREYSIEVAQPLAFTSTLARATKGQAYLQELRVSGGTAPYTLALTTGAWPAGLGMSAAGRVSGTPSATGSATLTIKVSDASGRILTQDFSLEVDEPLAITSGLSTAIAGVPFSQTLQASGGYGPFAWSLYSGTLPDGLGLHAASGVISGNTPTSSVTPLVLMVEDSAGRQAFRGASLIVTAPLSFVTTTLPIGAKNETYSEQIRVNGGLAPFQYTYTGLLPTGLSLNQTTGIISGTPTAAMLNNIQITVTDSSLPTPQTVTATLALRVTSLLTITSSAVLPTARLDQAISPVVLKAVSGVSPYQWSLASGSLPPGITLASDTGQLTGTPTAAGDYLFTLMVTDSKQPTAQTASKEFIYHVARPLSIDSNALPDGAKDIFYSYTLPVSGGRLPYAWQVKTGTLPAGLTLDAATGTIAGKPTTAASAQVTIAVTDGDTPSQTAEKTYAINISDRLFITTPTLPNGRLGQSYTTNLNVALGMPPYSFSVTEGLLPKGLSLTANALNATISGLPTEAGPATFTVTVTDSGVPMQTVSKQYSVSVHGLIAISTSRLPNAMKGESYSQTVVVSGGLPPYTWSVKSGQLPAGLSLDSATGRITGSPSSTPGISTEFTIQVSDAGQPAAPVDKLYALYVLEPVVITTDTIQGALQSAVYSAQIEGHGGLAPLSWSVSAGALPEGLSINAASGVISGQAADCGEFDFTLRLSDSSTAPLTVDKALHLSVLCSDNYRISGNVCNRPLEVCAGSPESVRSTVIKLTGPVIRETTTDVNGVYSFVNLPNGTYTVTPRKPVYAFSPESKTKLVKKDTSFGTFVLAKLLGDVNGDSRLTLADAIIAARTSVGYAPQDMQPVVRCIYTEADVNQDGKIGVADVIYILQSLAAGEQ